MTARKKYARTIDAAFESLTLDGKRLDYVQAYAHFDKLSQKRKPDEGWKRDLFWLVFHLTIEHGKSIAALTSGTTGPPKRITIPRRDLVNSARLTADTFDLREGDRVLLCLPCEYIAGKMMVVRAMALPISGKVLGLTSMLSLSLSTTRPRTMREPSISSSAETVVSSPSRGCRSLSKPAPGAFPST